MSRLNEAWRRASGSAVQTATLAIAAEREDENDSVPHGYPSENGQSEVTGIPDRRPFMSDAAPRAAGANQPLRLREDVAAKLVVDERMTPVAVEQYRRLAVTIHERRTQ